MGRANTSRSRGYYRVLIYARNEISTTRLETPLETRATELPSTVAADAPRPGSEFNQRQSGEAREDYVT